jgi:hypothetical protein
MDLWIRLAAALLLIAALPARAWGAMAMPLCAVDAMGGAAASAAVVHAAMVDPDPSQAMTPEHCAGHGSSAAANDDATPAGTDCSTCGFCHLACSSFLAPPPAAGLDDLLRPVLNAGAAGTDLSIPAAHAPPPPRA